MTPPTPALAGLARGCRARADAPRAVAFAQARFTALADALDRLEAAEKAVAQGGDRVLRCAFCGQPYPEGTPTHKHEALAAHIRECKEHPVGAELRTAVARVEAAERRAEEVDRLRLTHEEAQQAAEYVADNGPLHLESCPGDDTCACDGKPLNDAICKAIRLAIGTAKPPPPAAKGAPP